MLLPISLLPHVAYGGSRWNRVRRVMVPTLGCDYYNMLDIEEQGKLLIKANPSTLLGYFMESISH